MDLFESINSSGVTLVIVTHSAQVAGRCHRTIDVQDGRLVSGSALPVGVA